jgi:hypothetical protein
MTSVYDSERLAAAYAFDRPSVHAQILRSARLTRQAGRALDVTFLLYDFSTGGRSVSGDGLAAWFASFEQRFPWPPGWQPFDVRELPLVGYGLRLLDYTGVEVRLPMTFDAYLRYMLSETNVESAIARGACSAEAARDWCRETLKAVFAGGEVTVVIPGYVATLVLAAGE